MPKDVFDPQQFAAITAKLNNAYGEAEIRKGDFYPPHTPDGVPYECEFLGARCGVSTERKTAYVEVKWRVSEGEHADFTFSHTWYANENALGILKSALAMLYAEDIPMPDDLNGAMIGVANTIPSEGRFYKVALKTNAPHKPNMYINDFIGSGDDDEELVDESAEAAATA